MCEEKKPDEIVKIGHGVVFTVATTFGTSTINTTELQGVVYGVWVTESDHKFLGYKIQTSDGALYKIPGDRVRFQKKVA